MGDLFDDISNQLTPRGEVLATIGGGMVGSTLGGLAGVASLPFGVDTATDNIQAVQDLFSYQPRQQSSQQIMQKLGDYMQPVDEFMNNFRFGDEILNAGGSPAMATGANMIPELAESLLGLGALPSGRRAIKQGLINYQNAPNSPITPMRNQIGAIGIKQGVDDLSPFVGGVK